MYPKESDLEYISIDSANCFIKHNVVGNITKEDLDKERLKERNSADMMMS